MMFFLFLLCLNVAHASWKENLSPFLNQTPDAQLDYLKQQNLDIYRVKTGPITNDLVRLMVDAPEGPFHRFFSDFNKGTVGLYLTPHNHSYEVERGTLLISSDSGLWTITHELSHALIDQERSSWSESRTVEDLMNAKEDYEETLSVQRNLGYFPDSSYELRAYESMKTWTRIQVELLYQFEIEEVLIEKNLRKMFEEGAILLTKKSYDGSLWYINKNCTKAVNLVDHVNEVMEYLVAKLDAGTVKRLEKDIQTYRQYLSFHQSQIKGTCPWPAKGHFTQ